MTQLATSATDSLDAAKITPADWSRYWFQADTWGGDSCGCPDDRCIGHHHDATEPCGCLDVLLEEAMARRAADRTKSALREIGAMP